MTISSIVNRASYNGDGSTIVFPTVFPFQNNDDVRVILRDTVGVETEWTENTEYVLTGDGLSGGGTVTVNTMPSDFTPQVGERLVLIREPPLTQETDYPPGGAFPAEATEGALDKLTTLLQRLSERIDRAIQLAETDTDANLVLPSERENSLLGFDGLGVFEAVSRTTLGATLPLSSPDNSIPRFDGTDSTKLQASNVLIDDNDNVTIPSTGFLQLPSGTTAQRPGSPQNGYLRYNSENTRFEGYVNGDWTPLLSGAGNLSEVADASAARTNLGSAIGVDVHPFDAALEFDLFSGQLDGPLFSAPGDLFLLLNAPYDFTVTSFRHRLGLGACTATLFIAGVAVTGITAVNVTTVETLSTATGANSVTAGDRLLLELTGATSADADFAWQINGTRA